MPHIAELYSLDDYVLLPACPQMKAFVLVWLLPVLATCQSTTSPALPPWQTGVITEDGSCGGIDNWVCTPTWGACCSKDGMCGRSKAFCGDGCQPTFGNCDAPPPPPVKPPGPGDASPDGSCGGSNQFTCTNSTFGACCSSGNWCGDSSAHCGTACQSAFGTCAGESNISSDGKCGPNGKICLGSGFGDCCSSSGWCGGAAEHCGTGCQTAFGNCTAGSGSGGGDSGGNPGTISTDGTCAGTKGLLCKGSIYGDCCSSSGYCGSSAAHCGPGCQSNFGNCTTSGDVSTDGSCGKNGKTCKGSSFGDCCSSSGFCGGTTAHCGAGCQSGFGICAAADNISTDGTCGSNGKTCKGSAFGDCCSASGFCGASTDHCGAGCQTNAGTCSGAANNNISTDGSCGKNGKVCKGSTFGDCCSSGGFCGASTDHCGTGCQASFGTCTTAGSDNISTDGSCGKNGKTCKGSTFGDCCSSGGFCGKSTDHCGPGCQTLFGTCTAGAGSISTDGACGKNGKTCKGSTFGDCCSSSGFCGKSTDHCGAGCQSSFGTCTTGAGSVSTDGSCGKNGKTCKGSTFGDCCSANGFCGKSSDHCGTGCQGSFGTCNGAADSLSKDGACGSRNGKTCVGAGFGTCCSSTGYCGSTGSHCGQGCQTGSSSGCFTRNIPTNDGTCGASKGSFTCAGGPFDNQCCSSGGFCGTTSDHCGSGW
ncbi:hypothetical protein VDGL01_11718 [Verticillium dahliae]